MLKTTHIGSLPFKTIQEAINLNKEFSLPVLSTLPLIDDREFMLQQVLVGIKGYTHKDFKISLDERFELEEYKIPFLMEDAFIQSFAGLEVKWQVIGIVTLLKSINDLSEASKKQIINWHTVNIISYHQFLLSHFSKVHLFLDEPMYISLQDKADLKEFVDDLKKEQIKVNLHCCGEIKLECFMGLGLEGLSLDLEQIKETELQELNYHIKNIYLGVINTSSLELAKDHPRNRDFYYTPACGLAYSDPKKVLNIPKLLSSRTN